MTPPSALSATRAARLALIGAANAEMCRAKSAALDVFSRKHPVRDGARVCSDACQPLHRELNEAMARINADYQAALPRID